MIYLRVLGCPGKSQREAQEDEWTLKQLGVGSSQLFRLYLVLLSFLLVLPWVREAFAPNARTPARGGAAPSPPFKIFERVP